MKLLYIPSWYPSKSNPVDGAFFKEWAMAFSGKGHEVVVLANIIHSLSGVFKTGVGLRQNEIIKSSNDGLVEYRLEAINIHPGNETGFFSRYSKRLNRLFAKALFDGFKPDIAIIHSSVWAGSSIGEALGKNGIPYIVFEHLKELLIKNAITKLQMEAYKRSWANASAIVCVSSAVENSIASLDPSTVDKLVRIPNPVNTDFFSLKPVGNSKKMRFVTTALHRKEKRLDYLIRSFSEAQKQEPNITLKILGNGPEFDSNKKLIQKIGLQSVVSLEGFCNKEQVRHFLHNSDCLILASEVETFGIALLEALSVGLPVISTNCGGPADIINDKNGILVPVSEDTKVLAEAILEMVSRGKLFDADLIRNQTVEYYSIGNYISKCEELLGSIGAGKNIS